MPQLECVFEAKDWLGEGPCWHPGEQALYWTRRAVQDGEALAPEDRRARELARCPRWSRRSPCGDRAGSSSPRIPASISSIRRRGRANPLRRAREGQARQPLQRRQVRSPGPLLVRDDDEQFRRGHERAADHREHRRPLSHRPRRCGACSFEQALGIANTFAWSPDDSTMYFADTLDAIYAYDFDPATGRVSNRRTFAKADTKQIRPSRRLDDRCRGISLERALGRRLSSFAGRQTAGSTGS